MLINAAEDIHGPIIIMDLEWVGDTRVPYRTHVYDMACRNIGTGDVFSSSMPTLAANACASEADPSVVYRDWLAWLERQMGDQEAVYIVAHNGIRYDAPVLLHSMRKYGVPVPAYIKVMDSLHHLRYHMRHLSPKPSSYDIDSLCVFCELPVDSMNRHTAAYDVELLCDILLSLHCTYGIPIASGVAHDLDKLSTMLVHGIGPVVYSALPTPCLLTMCLAIIRVHGDLSPDACMHYLESHKLKQNVPLCQLDVIAGNIHETAQRHLQYLE